MPHESDAGAAEGLLFLLGALCIAAGVAHAFVCFRRGARCRTKLRVLHFGLFFYDFVLFYLLGLFIWNGQFGWDKFLAVIAIAVLPIGQCLFEISQSEQKPNEQPSH